MPLVDLTPQQLELARLIREIMVSDCDWDGSVWYIDPEYSAKQEQLEREGKPANHRTARVQIQDFMLDWVDVFDQTVKPHVATHAPDLSHDATVGCVFGILWREPGMERAYVRPVRKAHGPSVMVQGWVAYRLDDDDVGHPIEPRATVYASPVEAAGRAVLHLRAQAAAAKLSAVAPGVEA